MTIATIILSALLIGALYMVSYLEYKKDDVAKEAARRAVEECIAKFPNMADKPKDFILCHRIGEYIVTAQYCKGDKTHSFSLKRFSYDIGDSDDNEFARNRAVELIDKLQEK